MNRATTVKALLASLVAAAALVTGVLASGGSEPAGDAAVPEPARALPVDVERVEAKPVRLWSEFPARLQAVDEVDLRPQVSGAIVAVRFADGQRVDKGDVLFVIDPRPYQAAVTEAAAELAAARERHALASKDLERARSLIKTSAISERVLDERANAVAVSKSEIDAAAARLKRAEVDLDHAFVKAPISGRVSRAEITLGNLVQAGTGAPLLTSIVSDEEIYADFEVDERTYLRFVRAGADSREAERGIPVKLEVDGIAVDGYIHTFDNRIDAATGTIRARALFARASATLLPGMFARVALGTPRPEPAVLVNERAILTDQDRKFVYVVGADGKAAYRQVTLGATIEGKRVIASGLEEGERVITSNLMLVRPHTPVAPKGAAAAAHAAPAAAATASR